MIHSFPIAFREAKIVYNFGLSECNRVNISGEWKQCQEAEGTNHDLSAIP